MKVLVTGATGFVGNYVVKELVDKGFEVTASSSRIEKAMKCSWFSQVKYIPCDLRTVEDNYFRLFNEPDLLIHLAWEGLPDYEALFHFELNVPVQYSFLKNMIQNGLRHLVVAGTCLEYGMQNGCLSENLPTMPVVPYGVAKDTLRKYLSLIPEVRTSIFQWIRLFYSYGNGQSEKSLFSQIEEAVKSGEMKFNMSGGEQLRDYLPIERTAKYIVAIASQEKNQGIINCCSGKSISVRKLVETWLSERGYEIELNLGYYPYPIYEPMAFWGDTEKLKLALEASSIKL